MADQKQLVERIIAGDKNLFRELVKDHQRLVSHIVFRMIPPGPDREDLCQEVFVKVYQNLGKFRFDAKLSTWIARITYNSCLNFLDKKHLPLYDDLAEDDRPFEPAAPDDASRPDRAYESGRTGEIVRGEINRLPAVYKTLITLYHLEQMSYSEIGRIMKLPEGTVKSYLFRARKMLKGRLQAVYHGDQS
jgi:RNA polymerase sigma factor (sigma-70 family)